MESKNGHGGSRAGAGRKVIARKVVACTVLLHEDTKAGSKQLRSMLDSVKDEISNAALEKALTGLAAVQKLNAKERAAFAKGWRLSIAFVKGK